MSADCDYVRPSFRRSTLLMLGFVPSLIILGLVALAAVVQSGKVLLSSDRERLRAAKALAIATLAQSVHFIEELATGLHIHLPAVFGLPPIPLAVFVAFNLGWIAIWLYAIAGLRSNGRFALFAAWFLCIAGIVNGFAHPALALAVNGYFPGLFTAPPVLLASAWLLGRLRPSESFAHE